MHIPVGAQGVTIRVSPNAKDQVKFSNNEIQHVISEKIGKNKQESKINQIKFDDVKVEHVEAQEVVTYSNKIEKNILHYNIGDILTTEKDLSNNDEWLECNGQEIRSNLYPQLYDLFGGSVLPTEWESIGEFSIPSNLSADYMQIAKFKEKIYTCFQDYTPIGQCHMYNYTGYIYSIPLAGGNFQREQQLYAHRFMSANIKANNNYITVLTEYSHNNFVWYKQNSQNQFTQFKFPSVPVTTERGELSREAYISKNCFFVDDTHFLAYRHCALGTNGQDCIHYGNSPSNMANNYKLMPKVYFNYAIYYGAGYYCVVDENMQHQRQIGYTSSLSNSFVYLNSNNFQNNYIYMLKYLNNQWVAIIGISDGQYIISKIYTKADIATDEPWQMVKPPEILGNIRLDSNVEYDGGVYFLTGYNKDNKLCSWTCTDLNQEWTETIMSGDGQWCSNAIFNNTNWYLTTYNGTTKKYNLLKKTNTTPPNLPAIPPIKTTKATLKTYIKAKESN